MVVVKRARRFGVLSRRRFLAAWGVLRKKLAKTREYQQLRRVVFARSKGKCGGCGELVKWAGVVHHRVAVAWEPSLALTLSNCVWLCRACHAREHPELLGKGLGNDRAVHR